MLSFEPLEERPGLAVVDRLEQHRYRVHTPEGVNVSSVDTNGFRFPVGEAVRIHTPSLELPTVVGVQVRDESGGMVTQVKHIGSSSLPRDHYVIELPTRIKTYIEVESALEIEADLSSIWVDFGSEAEVRIGARSRHERPAATVTTTRDPVDLMDAVGTFGSALKTLDPERSYPTLRGHPPAVELGDTLSVPDCLQAPESGVTVEVPPTHEDVFVAAPLAYYLGATLEPGPTPRLVTETGFSHSLEGPRGYEQTVVKVLKHVFFLDCLTRTEGYYDLELHERRELDNELDLDFSALYDQSLPEQLAAYLEVPYESVADHVPQWRLTATIEAKPESAELLPYVVDDLAIVRTAANSLRSPDSSPPTVDVGIAGQGVFTRSATDLPRSTDENLDPPNRDYVQPVETDSLEQAWIGDRIPVGASKLTEAAFKNRFDRDLTDGPIRISVVVNDERMAEEHERVNAVYGNRDDQPFEVTVHRGTTVEGLRSVLTDKCGFLHYIGHTESDGFECADGTLDAASLDDVEIDAFLLNACNSYHQGLHLVEAGAIGGIVTLSDIINDGAIRMGESVARLLNSGFPLRASLTIARDVSIQGGQYIVVGDGGMTVSQAQSRTPNLLDISSGEEDYELRIKTFATDTAGLGSIFIPHLPGIDEYHLTSGQLKPFNVPRSDLDVFLQLEEVPVRIDDELHWSTSLTLDTLPI